jgi:TPR repeat protein
MSETVVVMKTFRDILIHYDPDGDSFTIYGVNKFDASDDEKIDSLLFKIINFKLKELGLDIKANQNESANLIGRQLLTSIGKISDAQLDEMKDRYFEELVDAAHKGDASAQNRLTGIFLRKSVATLDPNLLDEAEKWLKLAVASGYKDAVEFYKNWDNVKLRYKKRIRHGKNK